MRKNSLPGYRKPRLPASDLATQGTRSHPAEREALLSKTETHWDANPHQNAARVHNSNFFILELLGDPIKLFSTNAMRFEPFVITFESFIRYFDLTNLEVAV